MLCEPHVQDVSHVSLCAILKFNHNVSRQKRLVPPKVKLNALIYNWLNHKLYPQNSEKYEVLTNEFSKQFLKKCIKEVELDNEPFFGRI